MLMAGLRIDTPHINTFSGDATPRKAKVSFKQWYHEVQCIKDHHPEVVVCKSIIWLLKEAVADMARYMRSTASVDHILHILSVIFGTMASFNMLIQNFCKVIQENNEKVPSFATRLKGTLHQIQLQCPGRMMDLRSNNTSEIASSMEWGSISMTQSGTYTASLAYHIPSSW